jgi:K(+)-stimulated pyrophosphate-energized sodium pump
LCLRYQFTNVKGVWEGTVDPDYGKVVSICTEAAQKELLTPALLAIISPIVIGFLFGLEALAGFLAGVILVGQILAVFMSNAGGAVGNRRLQGSWTHPGYHSGISSRPDNNWRIPMVF